MEQIKNFIEFIGVSALAECYTLENIAFGELHRGDKIPFERYAEDLELHPLTICRYKDRIEGFAISEGQTVSNEDRDRLLKEHFADKINVVFQSAPKKGYDTDDDGLYNFKYGIKEYIWELYPLYIKILNTEIEHDPFDIVKIFPDRASETACYEKISKFVVSIWTKGLKQGSCVDRYVKDLPYIPYFVKQLLKIQKNRRLLANSDSRSINYKLAILSCIQFMNPTHTRLFELKAAAWRRRFAI